MPLRYNSVVVLNLRNYREHDLALHEFITKPIYLISRIFRSVKIQWFFF